MNTITQIQKPTLNDWFTLFRVKLPAGWLLVYLPCLWGIALGNHFTSAPYPMYKILLWALFFLVCAVMMRSAGCIWNDIVDKKFDAKTPRTCHRPLVTGVISVKTALTIAILLTLISFVLILIFVNWLTIFMATISLLIAIIYPYTKRFTRLPQIVLGLCFNFGVIIGFTAVTGYVTPALLWPYMAGIFWTLTYDTLYAWQDYSTDKKNNVKSMTQLIAKAPKVYIGIFYTLMFLLLMAGAYAFSLNLMAYVFLLLIYFVALGIVRRFDPNIPATGHKAFTTNPEVGILIALAYFFA